MVIISTSAVEVSIQAVSPVSSLGAGWRRRSGSRRLRQGGVSTKIKPTARAASAHNPARVNFFNVMVLTPVRIICGAGH